MCDHQLRTVDDNMSPSRDDHRLQGEKAAQELAGSGGANASGHVTGLAVWRQTVAKKDFTGLRGQ